MNELIERLKSKHWMFRAAVDLLNRTNDPDIPKTLVLFIAPYERDPATGHWFADLIYGHNAEIAARVEMLNGETIEQLRDAVQTAIPRAKVRIPNHIVEA